MARRTDIQEQLRRAIKRDSRSLYALARDAGLGIGPLQRFVAREHGMTLTSAEKLATALGLVLTLTPAERRSP